MTLPAPSTGQRRRPRRRLHWGVAIALVYLAFAVATMGFVVFALGQPVDLVSADYYAQSLRQDERLAARRRADALGAALDASLTSDGRTLVLRVPREAAIGAVGTVTLYRPSNGGSDRSVPIQLNGDGVQRLPLAGLERGRWLLYVDWRAGGAHYRYERTLHLR